MAGRLKGKVALITGTGGVQGRAAARRFAEEGALVVGCDLDEERHLETVAMVKAAGHQMVGSAPVDLGDPDEARQWVEEAARHGAVDVLYNNASAAKIGVPIPDVTVEDWHFTVRNELDLVFYVTKYAWRHLAVRGGVIINVASVAGVVGVREVPELAHAATKGGVIAMTRQMAVEGAAVGIRAVCLSPGPVGAPAAKGLAAIGALDAIEASLLVPRFGRPEDIAELALFLASEDAAWVTGINIAVDGGITAH